MALTIDDVKLNMPDAETISESDDDVITRCLNTASVFIDTYITASGKTVSADLRDLIVIKRTKYELYMFSSDYQLASEHKEDALTMLKAALGYDESTGGSIAQKQPTSYIVKPLTPKTDLTGF